jgi:phosphate butyryltransferase
VAKQLNTLQAIVDSAVDLGARRGPCPLAVAVAQDSHVLGALVEAHRSGMIRGLLYGSREKMLRLAEEEELSLDGLEIVDIPDDLTAARAAVAAVDSGEARLLMKGFVKTGDLLRLVLSKEFNLRKGGLLSHVAVMEIPALGRLIAISDGGMVVKPSMEEKIVIIENAGAVMRALGVSRPRVALLSMTDVVQPSLPSTLENATLGKMGDRRQFRHLVVDGPITFDVAFSDFAARYHGLRSPVAGRTDILIVNSIEEGNILIKSLAFFVKARFAGIIAGCRVPISLVSRTDSLFNKKASIALGILLGEAAERRD